MRATGASVRISAPSDRAADAIASLMPPVPPLRDAPGAERAVDLAHVVVQQHVRGAGRAHAQERPDDARRRHRRLQQIGLEPLVEEVRGAHRHQLDERLLEPLGAARRSAWPGRPRAATRAGRCRPGSGGIMDRMGLTNRAISTMAGRTPRRPRRRSATTGGSRGWSCRGRSRATGSRRRAGVNVPSSGRISRPCRGRSRSRMISGPQQRHHVGEDAEPEAGEDLLGDGRAAQDVAALQDQHALAGLAPGTPPP